jgi:hypothetical protein
MRVQTLSDSDRTTLGAASTEVTESDATAGATDASPGVTGAAALDGGACSAWTSVIEVASGAESTSDSDSTGLDAGADGSRAAGSLGGMGSSPATEGAGDAAGGAGAAEGVLMAWSGGTGRGRHTHRGTQLQMSIAG